MCSSASRSRAAAAVVATASGESVYAEWAPYPSSTRSPGPNRRPSASIHAEIASRICSQVPRRSIPGAVMMPGVMTTRDPSSRTASTTVSAQKYISVEVVTPWRSISSPPASIPARTSGASSRASAGQTTSVSQRISGRSPPMPAQQRQRACARGC